MLNEIQLDGIDLNVLLLLDVLLQERSVTRAAARVRLTPSAMSHALRRLRELFGDPLLVRGKGGLMLTPRAEELRIPLRRSLQDLTRVVQGQVSFEPRTATRTFRIACTDYVEAVVLPRLLRRVSEESPGVVIQARAIERDLPHELEIGGVDVAIGPYLDTEPGLVQRRLFEEEFVCIVRRDHPLVGDKLDLKTYTALPHALFSPRGEGSSRADAVLAAKGLQRRTMLRVPHILTAVLMVTRSNLVLTTPRRIVTEFAELWPIRAFEPPIPLSTFDVKMLWHERYQRDPAHVWLRRAIIAEMEDASSGAQEPAPSAVASPASRRRRTAPR